MGGSGSGGLFSGSWEAEELAKRAREAEDQARSEEFDTVVADYLGSLLVEYNSRDARAIERVLDGVVEDLGAYVDGVDRTLFGGSVSRHTYVNGISDVDALVLFDANDVEGKGPEELKGILAESLRGRYGVNAVKIGVLAVTVETKEGDIQLLPALRTGDSFQIAGCRRSGLGQD